MNHCFSIDWIILMRCFQQEIVGLGEDGNPKKRVQECFKQTFASTFLDYLWPNLQRFVQHNFIAR
jgi:hypothetical protein